MPKTPEMEEALENIGKVLYGNSRVTAAVNETCVICSGPAEEFSDALSKEEYRISRMCQVCQDEVFG